MLVFITSYLIPIFNIVYTKFLPGKFNKKLLKASLFIVVFLYLYNIYIFIPFLNTIITDPNLIYFKIVHSLWFPFSKDILIYIVMDYKTFILFIKLFLLWYDFFKLEHLFLYLLNIPAYIFISNIWGPLLFLFLPFIRFIFEYLKDYLNGVEPDFKKYFWLVLVAFTSRLLFCVGFNLWDLMLLYKNSNCFITSYFSGSQVKSKVLAYTPIFTSFLYTDQYNGNNEFIGPDKMKKRGNNVLSSDYNSKWIIYHYEVGYFHRPWTKLAWDLWYSENMCATIPSLRIASWEHTLVMKYFSTIPNCFSEEVLRLLGNFGPHELFYRRGYAPTLSAYSQVHMMKIKEELRELRISVTLANTNDPLIINKMMELKAELTSSYSFNIMIQHEREALENLNKKIPLKSSEIREFNFFRKLDNFIHEGGEHPLAPSASEAITYPMTSQVGLTRNIYSLGVNPDTTTEAGPSNRILNPTQVAFTNSPDISLENPQPSISQNPSLKRNFNDGPGMDNVSEISRGKRRRID